MERSAARGLASGLGVAGGPARPGVGVVQKVHPLVPLAAPEATHISPSRWHLQFLPAPRHTSRILTVRLSYKGPCHTETTTGAENCFILNPPSELQSPGIRVCPVAAGHTTGGAQRRGLGLSHLRGRGPKPGVRGAGPSRGLRAARAVGLPPLAGAAASRQLCHGARTPVSEDTLTQHDLI